MNYQSIYAIASQALDVESLRVQTIANNIANQYTIQSKNAPPFQAKEIVTTAAPFIASVEIPSKQAFESIEILSKNTPPNLVYAPEHPMANPEGYISYPGINTVDEMTTLVKASRAYEADIKIMNAAHSMYLQALSIGENR